MNEYSVKKMSEYPVNPSPLSEDLIPTITVEGGKFVNRNIEFSKLKGDKGDTGPQGEPGDDGNTGASGKAATVEVGSVSTGPAGSSATVENTGDEYDAVLDFTIPKGDKGDQGDPGVVQSVNGKSQANVVLTPTDIGADAAGSASNALTSANDYTDAEIAGIDYPVDSVNGQTNVVTLDATDVGADAAGSAAQALTDANDYTDTQIAAIDYPVDSVSGKTGAVTLVKGDVGLGNVDNTSDLGKPVSTAQQVALDGKVDETSTASQAYVTDASGNQATIPYGEAFNLTSGLVQRTSGNQINVPTPASSGHAASKNYVDTADALKVNKAGDTMTGQLIVNPSTSIGNGAIRLVQNSNTILNGVRIINAGVTSAAAIGFESADTFGIRSDGALAITGVGSRTNISGVDYLSGTGFPNGVISAPVGSIYIDTAATGEVVKWSKVSGSSNTGWAPTESEWRRVSTTRTTSTISAPVIYQGVFPSSYKFVRIVASGSVGGGGATDLYFNFETPAPTAISADFKKWYDSSGARVYLSVTNSQNSSTLENLSTGASFGFDSTWMFAGNGAWNSYNTLASAARGTSSVKDEYLGYTRTSGRPTTFAITQSASAIINTGLRVEVYVK